MDFSRPDHLTAAQVQTLNCILWHDAKGPNAPYPAPVHRALIASSGHSVLPPKSAQADDDETGSPSH